MARNENWSAVEGKAKGDSVTLVLRGNGYDDFRERFTEGTIVKATPATRSFTVPGALYEGLIRTNARHRHPTENNGIVDVEGTRAQFRIATPQDIARLTDPLRDQREALDAALRVVRYHREKATKEHVAALIADLKAALAAAEALHGAQPDPTPA